MDVADPSSGHVSSSSHTLSRLYAAASSRCSSFSPPLPSSPCLCSTRRSGGLTSLSPRPNARLPPCCSATSTTDRIQRREAHHRLVQRPPPHLLPFPSSARVEDLLLESSHGRPGAAAGVQAASCRAARASALAVLFPKKLCVYVVNSIKPTASCSLRPVRSLLPRAVAVLHSPLPPPRALHDLSARSARPARPFLSSSSSLRDSIAVLTLDGQLLFYSQDTFAFSRYLPGFLLPGSLPLPAQHRRIRA